MAFWIWEYKRVCTAKATWVLYYSIRIDLSIILKDRQVRD
jgi:hypothetical protein